ncbi:MAG: ExbD/TolR family protein [Longimicrobiales bacterium]
MLNFRRRRRRGLPVNADISITNVIDVAFVLLIIFMITAPILQGGIEVQLPRADAAPITTSDDVIVSIAANGDLYIDKTRVASVDEFETVFKAYMAGSTEERPVTLKSDTDVPWGRVAEVMGLLNRLEVTDIGIAVEPRNR